LTPLGVALVPPRRDGAPPWGCGCFHRLGQRTATRKWERKARRGFDTAIEYGTVMKMAREKTRTRHSQWRAVPASCYPLGG
jgi:hypothetical protein